jgi:FtsH-binding integral membrane protein
MERSLMALVMAVIVGGTVGTATYAVARGADPLVQALATGAAAFAGMMALYLLTSERG